MPQYIRVLITWDPDGLHTSHYVLYEQEIYELMINYEQDQALLFTFIELKYLLEWMWDVFCREPHSVKISEIKF